MMYGPSHCEIFELFGRKIPCIVALIILSGAPTSQNIDFKASITSVECRLSKLLTNVSRHKQYKYHECPLSMP